MGGRYYLKHTINHIVSNESQRRKSGSYSSPLSSQDYKKINEFRISNGISIVTNNNWTYDQKLKAFKDFHYNEVEIQQIICNSNNDEFCKTYCGKTVTDYKKHIHNTNIGCLFAILVFIVIIVVIIK